MDEFDKYIIDEDKLDPSTLAILKTLSEIFDCEVNELFKSKKE